MYDNKNCLKSRVQPHHCPSRICSAFFPHKLNKSTGIPAFHSILHFNYKVMTCLPRAIWASQPVQLFQWIVFIGSTKLLWGEVN